MTQPFQQWVPHLWRLARWSGSLVLWHIFRSWSDMQHYGQNTRGSSLSNGRLQRQAVPNSPEPVSVTVLGLWPNVLILYYALLVCFPFGSWFVTIGVLVSVLLGFWILAFKFSSALVFILLFPSHVSCLSGPFILCSLCSLSVLYLWVLSMDFLLYFEGPWLMSVFLVLLPPSR